MSEWEGDIGGYGETELLSRLQDNLMSFYGGVYGTGLRQQATSASDSVTQSCWVATFIHCMPYGSGDLFGEEHLLAELPAPLRDQVYECVSCL